MNIRIEGTAEEIEAASQIIRQAFAVQEESRNYFNRSPSKLFRRYWRASFKPDQIVPTVSAQFGQHPQPGDAVLGGQQP